MSYRKPAKIIGATLFKDDPGDANKDGFNEAEGCHVLQGPGPLRFTYERGQGSGFAPTFKVIGWNGNAPRIVKVERQNAAAASASVDGKLILQVLGRIDAEKAVVEIGERK